MNKHDLLISNLSRDLAPVSPPPNVNILAMVWILLSAIYVVAVTHLFGPVRSGAFSQLATDPRFLLESMLGLAAISADDLRAFHKRTLARDNLHVAVVGAIDAQELGTALDAMFGALPDHADLVPVADITPQAGARVHKTLDVPQTTIRVGGASIKRDDPDFIPAYLANHILGGGSFSSRLYKEIREERGLAYSVGTGLAAFDHAGAYVGAAATRADAAKLAIELMTGQIREFAENGPTDKELASAISYLTGNYALRFDASRKIARQLIGIQLDKLGIDYVDKRNDLVRAVSADDVRRAAKRVFGGPITVITVGPDQDDS